GHDALRSFLARAALGGIFGRGGPSRTPGGRRGGLAVAPLARRIPDALHVAGLADEARHLGEAAAFHADLGQNRIDQGGLYAVAKRRVDHLVGGAAAAIAAAVAGKAVDLKD